MTPSYSGLGQSIAYQLTFIKAAMLKLLLTVIPFSGHSSSRAPTWLFVGMTAVCGIGTVLYQWNKRKSRKPDDEAAASNDSGLLRKHSTFEEYRVPSTGFTYPRIRTFYRPHPRAKELPQEPCPIPLLVFIHGLGGTISQFNDILHSLSNLAPTLAIDLPGCGTSAMEPKDWKAYTSNALVELLATVIETRRSAGQGVVLIAHSMGCSLATLLASSTSPHAGLISAQVVGLIAICPQAKPLDERHAKGVKFACSIPPSIFDLVRKWDRRGGNNSKSVRRMAGPDADDKTKELQRLYNERSRTPAWQRMMYGMLSTPSGGGLPSKEVWAGLKLPVFLIGGEDDTVTPAENVKILLGFLGRDVSAIDPPSEKASMPIAAAPVDPSALIDPSLSSESELERKHQDSGIDTNDLPRIGDSPNVSADETASAIVDEATNTPEDSSTASETPTIVDPALTTTASSKNTTNSPSPHPRRLLVKTAIFPKPAAHSLVFAPSTAKILSGFISNFLSDDIDPRLSAGWQLQYLTTGGKWDVKNLEKWKNVEAVSEPIGDFFRAMKTLREVDQWHTPQVFAKEWKGKIRAVVDISHDSPVYDPKGLEEGGIKYYKFPTVSKLPPNNDEVSRFIELIDKVRAEADEEDRRNAETQPPPLSTPDLIHSYDDYHKALIAVHCHYGFNRTGYFLVCYLVERLGWDLSDAIEEFRQKRSPGIRHAHFVDALYCRYQAPVGGIRRVDTL